MAPLTLLRATGGKTFAKRITQTAAGIEKTAYDHVTFVDADMLVIADLEEFCALLQEIERDPAVCLIRGALIDGTSAQNIRRLLHDREDAKATFRDQPSSLVMIDIDDFQGDPAWSPAQRLARIVHSLPTAFHDADFVFQWSSSAGIEGWSNLKVHLWFWLDQPVTSARLKAQAVAESWRIDNKVFQPVQPHYTAAPTLVGLADPLGGNRTGLVRRASRTVNLPAWAPPEILPRAAPTTVMVNTDDPAYQDRVRRWVAAVIENECERISSAPDGDQNDQIFRSARALGRLVGGDLITRADAEFDLARAARLGGHPEYRARAAIRSGLDAGIQKPRAGPDEK